jgi:hypothetical protein
MSSLRRQGHGAASGGEPLSSEGGAKTDAVVRTVIYPITFDFCEGHNESTNHSNHINHMNHKNHSSDKCEAKRTKP